jgi:hypothetical protein
MSVRFQCNARNKGSGLVEIIEGGQDWANAFAPGSQLDTAPLLYLPVKHRCITYTQLRWALECASGPASISLQDEGTAMVDLSLVWAFDS